jgi:DNA-binding MarR family transcriptional regulator
LGNLIMADYQDCIIFLLAKAYQRVHLLFKRRLSPFGITPVQHLILEVLWKEGNISLQKISEKTVIDCATLSSVIDRMTVAGLLTRKENSLDRRSIKVSLSPNGKKLWEEMEALRQEINKELIDSFSPEEMLLFKRMLRDLKGKMVNIGK